MTDDRDPDLEDLLDARQTARQRRERDDPVGDLIRQRDREIAVLLDDDLTPTPRWWRRVIESDGPLGDF